MDDDIDPRENAMFDAHYAEIEKRFGRERAAKANLGWGHSPGSLCSKVYGKTTNFLTTSYNPETFEVLGHYQQ